MAGFRLYPPVREALEDIWYYTFQTWGEEQADHYIRQIYAGFNELAEGKRPWRELSGPLRASRDVPRRVFFSRVQKHYVFFRKLKGEEIGILSILHEAMDMPMRLREDMERIEEK
jgi:plasmid stabilization system protein ParE